MFQRKKRWGFINTIFLQSYVAEGFPNNKRCRMQKKGIYVKLIYFIKTNLIISFFSRCLVKFFRNIIKYVVSILVSGTLKVALFRVITIPRAFCDDS